MKFLHLLVLALALFAVVASAQEEKKEESKKQKPSVFDKPLTTADYVSLYVGIGLFISFVIAGVLFVVRRKMMSKRNTGFVATTKSLQSV